MHEDESLITNDRREAFTLIAMGVASMGDLATMLASGGNPLVLNYAMWLDLSRRIAKQARRRSTRAALVTIDDATVNQNLLNQGWADLLG